MEKQPDPLSEMSRKFLEKLQAEREALAKWHVVNKPAVVVKMHPRKKNTA